MAGNGIQVGLVSGHIRIKNDGIVIAGVSDPCCCTSETATYRRLLDCCENDWSDYVVAADIDAAVIISNSLSRCFVVDPPDPYGSGTTYTEAEVTTNGWTIFTSSDYQIVATTWGYEGGPGCDAAGCNAIYLAARRYCDSSDNGLFGWVTPIPEGIETVTEYSDLVVGQFFQYGGAWWEVYDVVAVPWCDHADWLVENEDLIISGTIPDLYAELDPNVCCHVYGTFPDSEGCEVPCCLQLTVGDFSCPEMYCSGSSAPVWDGVMTKASGNDDYAPGGDCGSQDVSGGIRLPGMNCNVVPRLYWEPITGTWRLLLGDGIGGIYWGGAGPSDPCDPVGTYTFDGYDYGVSMSQVLPSPGCSQLAGASMPSTQPGTGPTTIDVAQLVI